MRPLYPSLTLTLPEDWHLLSESGALPCHHAQLLVESQEKILPPDWKSTKEGPPQRHQLRGVHLLFQGTQSTWERIQTEELFGYHLNRAGAIFGGSFNPNQTYFFTLDLRSSPLTLLSLMNEHLAQLQETFLQSSIAQELRKEHNYRLLEVTQPLPSNPSVQLGMTIHWDAEY